METGYDIIFFWVARMMMLGLELTGKEPFHTVYLSGLIRDPLGQKMSKTKGNVVDPLGVIDTAGADALRFAVIHGATPGNDQRFGEAKLEHARNFANKLWNATRYVVGARPATIPDDAERRLPDVRHLGPAERWLLSRAAATTEAVDAALSDYAFGEMTRLVYDAIWSEYCDWGLELAKVRLGDTSLDADAREATWWALVEVLDTYLRLLHPVMPFVTEALWAHLPHRATDPDLLIVARWPGVGERDLEAETEVGAVDRPRDRDPQRARHGQAPGGRLARDPRRRADRARADVRGPPARDRTPRPRAAAPARADARGARGGDTARRPRGHRPRRPDRGDRPTRARPTPAPDRSSASGSSATSSEAEGWLAAARERLANDVVRVARPGGRRRERPRPRSGAGRAGRAAARTRSGR